MISRITGTMVRRFLFGDRFLDVSGGSDGDVLSYNQATSSIVLSPPPASSYTGMALVGIPGEATVSDSKLKLFNITGSKRSLLKALVNLGSAPSGSSLIIAIKVDGSTKLTVTVPSGTDTVQADFPPNSDWDDGQYISCSITQVGSSSPGADISVHISHSNYVGYVCAPASGANLFSSVDSCWNIVSGEFVSGGGVNVVDGLAVLEYTASSSFTCTNVTFVHRLTGSGTVLHKAELFDGESLVQTVLHWNGGTGGYGCYGSSQNISTVANKIRYTYQITGSHSLPTGFCSVSFTKG